MYSSLASELYSLRKANQLDEAVERFTQACEEEKEHPSVQDAWTWIQFSLLKAELDAKNGERVLAQWNQVPVNYIVEKNDEIMSSQFIQLANRTLFLVKPETLPNLSAIIQLYLKLTPLPCKPESAPFLVGALTKQVSFYPVLLPVLVTLLETHLPTNAFIPEDFNGKKIPSVWERAYTAIHKQLLKQETILDENVTLVKQLQRIDKRIETESSKPKFFHYYKAKWYERFGNQRLAVAHYLKLLTQVSDAWVFASFAQALKSLENDAVLLRIQLNERAWLRQKKQDMSVSVLEQLVEDYMLLHDYEKASWALYTYLNIRQRNQWKIPQKWQYYAAEDWYNPSSGIEPKTESCVASTLCSVAGELRIPLAVQRFVVTGNNHGSTFLTDANGTSYRLKSVTIPLYSLIDVCVLPNGELLPFYERVSESDSRFIKTFTGTIRVFDAGFGLLNKAFVPPGMVKKLGSFDRRTVFNAQAHISFNKSKQQQGWTVYAIEPAQEVYSTLEQP